MTQHIYTILSKWGCGKRELCTILNYYFYIKKISVEQKHNINNVQQIKHHTTIKNGLNKLKMHLMGQWGKSTVMWVITMSKSHHCHLGNVRWMNLDQLTNHITWLDMEVWKKTCQPDHALFANNTPNTSIRRIQINSKTPERALYKTVKQHYTVAG